MAGTMKPRLRFAPSPTGFFHIGSARTALFNWLYARHTGGTFILRIEDTDETRNSPEMLELIYSSLRWLGMDWDEGPIVGGPHGPYLQSERADIYAKYLERLKATGRTYEQDGAIYFRVSGKPALIRDIIRGNVERLEEKDFVIVRSNGMPVFHFVNVVDDIDMQITHVVRGEDHLSNTSKHVELFEAFGVPVPHFAHLPLILKTSGPGKMSKRDQGALIEEYKGRYFLPKALRNFLCLLGWSPKEDREILPIEQLISLFELSAINKSNARFDEQKLIHINGEYLRGLPLNELLEKTVPVLKTAGLIDEKTSMDYIQEVLRISQEKLRSLEELPTFIGYFFNDDFSYDEAAREKITKKGNPALRLQEFKTALESQTDWSTEALEVMLTSLASTHGITSGEYIHPARFACSGQNVGPSFYALLKVLGKERVLRRVQTLLKSFVNE
jgi:glutamyl-tRNA synthetase